MPGIGVVINPYAGQNVRLRHRAEQFTATVGEVGLVRQTASLDEMEEVARQFREQRIDILAICGGDGSFSHTLSVMLRQYGAQPLPAFLPLRAGSMNTLARSVGCRHGSPERVLGAIVADYRAGRPIETTERHLIQVNGQQFGFMVGAGSMVHFLQEYYGGTGRGPVAAGRLFARTALSALTGSPLARRILQHVEADVDCDGERVPHRRFNVIYASTITDIGLGFRATYLATRKRGYFHLLAGRLRGSQLLTRLRRLRHGWPFDVDELYDNLARHVTVEFPRPTHYMIDGEVLGTVSALDLHTGPRLTIIRR